MRRHSLSILALSTGMLVGGCARQSPNPTLVGQGQRLDDYEIFEVALSDMIGNKEYDPAVGGGSKKKPQIVLQSATFGGVSERFLSSLAFGQSKTVSLEIRSDLLKRNPKGERYSLVKYHPSNSNILLSNLSGTDIDLAFTEVFPDAQGYVQPYLPGYSLDRQSSLFFSFRAYSPQCLGILSAKPKGRSLGN